MSAEEHLRRVLSDLQAKAKVARLDAEEKRIKADAFEEAARVVEVEITRLPAPKLCAP